MKNTIGHVLKLTVFGESHGEAIGCVLDGLPSGMVIDENYIASMMQKRQGLSAVSTGRREPDHVSILSGVYHGKTEGTPLTLLIRNSDVRSADYSSIEDLARPGHADYTAEIRYEGCQDKRGGGHFSGRLTAALTAAGAILMHALEEEGILIGSHIQRLHGIADRDFGEDTAHDIQLLKEREFPVLDDEQAERMIAEIKDAREKGDSVGGILETIVTGLPAGLGEPMFGSVESRISEAMFSIGAVKGVTFGIGAAFADLYGSEANDPFACRDGKITTLSNHNGGVNGGITNGMPVCFQTVIKPTPSISLPQKTVNMKTKENTVIEIKGRHDPAVIHRAAVVVSAMTAFVLADLLSEAYGRNWLRVLRERDNDDR